MTTTTRTIPHDPTLAKARVDSARGTVVGAATAFVETLDAAGTIGHDNVTDVGRRLARLRHAVAAYKRAIR